MAIAAVPTVQCDNQRVRVTEWHFNAGAETGHHRHELDYVVVPMSSGQLKMIGSDGIETTAQLTAGQSYFRTAGAEHNVVNINDHPFTFVEIELK